MVGDQGDDGPAGKPGLPVSRCSTECRTSRRLFSSDLDVHWIYQG